MSEIKLVEHPTKGKTQTVVINGKPFWKWGRKEHAMWQMETRVILKQIDRLGEAYMKYMRMRQ